MIEFLFTCCDGFSYIQNEQRIFHCQGRPYTENVGRLFSSAYISTWKNDDILNFLLKDVPSIALLKLHKSSTKFV